ncbi:MAG: hypothetical protein RLZZ609_2946 [Cyanobacteriota bacterium]|jgi:hypothetical protein
MHLSRYRNPALFVEHSLRPGDGKRSHNHPTGSNTSKMHISSPSGWAANRLRTASTHPTKGLSR